MSSEAGNAENAPLSMLGSNAREKICSADFSAVYLFRNHMLAIWVVFRC